MEEQKEHEFNKFIYYFNYDKGELPRIEHSKQTPQYLFKYYGFGKNNIEAFANSYLYASHPFELNDILDSSRFLFFTSKTIQFEDYEKFYFQEKKVFKTEKEFIQFYKDDIKNDCSEYLSHLYNVTSNYYGVISLSGKEDNVLMWPHYTQEKGFQVKFKTDDILKSISNLLGSYDRIIGLFPMNYTAKIQPIDVFKFRRFDIPLIYSTNVKLDSWEYEKEWRILISKPKMGIPFEKLGFSDIKNHDFEPKKRYTKYSIDAIDSICLGFNFFSGSDFINKLIGEKEIEVQPRKEIDQCDLYIQFLDFIIDTFSGKVYISGVKYETDLEGSPYLIRTKERVVISKLKESKYLIVRTGEIIKFNY
ncbi:DUF2971 domain-containing protein [Belliella kenyensis]|uniref:DUF2971 domain-containing protein n=1 Tax=Belliella kenyensis TaxID=1472724 RepID=A0ABV8EM09_9BACT|nr:DUF2971 domain-containing protein [Belliella kenyensis]MCH7400341.1 DUF2971 domain-containing protein [Belliella kenyensis]MDN3604641.1 DUF2971 domain-containing protein [Belliella kenyensis]